MLMKMKENKGFTLVELMIVVAIIGILAAVAVPFYQRYVQKARLTSLVWPGMHSVETNIGAFYAVRNSFPENAQLPAFTRDADLTYFSNMQLDASNARLSFQINSPGATSPLAKLHGKTLEATAQTTAGKITAWVLSGELADELGLK
ncbi:MAG: prepilin-type N-terminal cleavage/methylation domain-containing protein [Deltaproteobacteria bacterium]|nr:prepilin-type N-terminal cleavage/methylation domain-containing protein [Deltaproteobacteria bacterium]